ncbi:hypothetical protein ACFQDG_08920 [Natronoarchaeum mannanilyticum]|uniref:Pilin/flagellin n=1 Tax=Natronoarchaeum mannanilyticum TaxID=926360 RepID=A0AAV3T4L8_9EURY
MSGDRLPGAAFGDDERAQTVQDFAVGISIFLLVVGAVFLMFPSLFTPYEQAIADEGPDSQADRIGMLIADNVTGDEGTNELTSSEINYWFAGDEDDLRRAVGVSSNTQVNVTLTTIGTDREGPIALDDDDADIDADEAAVGPSPEGRDTSTAARIVTVGDNDWVDDPGPAYRLVVRVW